MRCPKCGSERFTRMNVKTGPGTNDYVRKSVCDRCGYVAPSS